jgi:hypothetical protein
MQDVEDEDTLPRNVAPSNPSCLFELSDISDNEDEDHAPKIIEVDDDDKEEEPEESAEAELSQLLL